jgi:hypothetical protein
MRAHRRRVRLRLRPQQCPRIGMLRRFEYAFGGALLDDPAFLHHANRVGELPYDPEIVRDEQHRHSQARLQLFEEREDLRLDGDVERGRRFIRDEEVGLVGERNRDHDPLTLPPRELVGIAVQACPRVRNPHLLKELKRAPASRLSGQSLMQEERLADLLFNGMQRI